MRIAKYKLGDVVKHRLFPFRGVVFDIDPVFNNTEEWWLSIPAEVRPHKDQPFYHLFAENAETEYVAYVSEQNLLPDTSGDPVRHPQVAESIHEGRQRRLPSAQLGAELDRESKRPRPLPGPLPFAISARTYFCWLSSRLRASSARFCSSSCSFFCCSSNTFGSVGGPS